MIFHHTNKNVNEPQIKIDNILVDCVNQFSFLGITIDKSLSWNYHLAKVQSKISRACGIINRMKHILPQNIKRILYYSLVAPHLNYGISLWGSKGNKLLKTQKKLVRIITLSKYNAHCDPIFKSLNILKITDMYEIAKYKIYYKYIHRKLPVNLLNMNLIPQTDIHNHDTRNRGNLYIHRVNHVFAEQMLCACIPKLINSAPQDIKSKVLSHSLDGFSLFVKQHFIKKYNENCNIPNCYICQQNTIS